MPRQPRLDASVALHHVMDRGIDGTKIFSNTKDREDFLEHLADLFRADALRVYAWALMSNHFYLLLRTGNQRLSNRMRKLLTGYFVKKNTTLLSVGGQWEKDRFA
jgi:putative transposase